MREEWPGRASAPTCFQEGRSSSSIVREDLQSRIPRPRRMRCVNTVALAGEGPRGGMRGHGSHPAAPSSGASRHLLPQGEKGIRQLRARDHHTDRVQRSLVLDRAHSHRHHRERRQAWRHHNRQGRFDFAGGTSRRHRRTRHSNGNESGSPATARTQAAVLRRRPGCRTGRRPAGRGSRTARARSAPRAAARS